MKGKKFEGEYLYIALCSGSFDFEEQKEADETRDQRQFIVHITPKFFYDHEKVSARSDGSVDSNSGTTE